MEVGGVWRQPAMAERTLSHPENFSLRRKESLHSLIQKKRYFRGKPATVCMFTMLLSQQRMRAWDPLAAVSFSPISLQHLFKQAKRTPYARTLLAKQEGAKKWPPRVRLFPLQTPYCTQKAPLYLRSSQCSNVEREKWMFLLGRNRAFALGKPCFPKTVLSLALFFSGWWKKHLFLPRQNFQKHTKCFRALWDFFFFFKLKFNYYPLKK